MHLMYIRVCHVLRNFISIFIQYTLFQRLVRFYTNIFKCFHFSVWNKRKVEQRDSRRRACSLAKPHSRIHKVGFLFQFIQ